MVENYSIGKSDIARPDPKTCCYSIEKCAILQDLTPEVKKVELARNNS
jgi:hypothetical protein